MKYLVLTLLLSTSLYANVDYDSEPTNECGQDRFEADVDTLCAELRFDGVYISSFDDNGPIVYKDSRYSDAETFLSQWNLANE
jgi:hypothetical protein